jgi:hypothetical protein
LYPLHYSIASTTAEYIVVEKKSSQLITSIDDICIISDRFVVVTAGPPQK